jgi:hypothetical protein
MINPSRGAETMEPQKQRYWFPAKRYGWGWGPPTTWQGWVVVVVSFISIIVGAQLLKHRTIALLLFVVVNAGALLAICLAKGEPTRWRWGGDKDR